LAWVLHCGKLKYEQYKRKPLNAAVLNMKTALHSYGSTFSDKLDAVRGYLETLLVRLQSSVMEVESDHGQRKSRPLWWVWQDGLPSPNLLATVQVSLLPFMPPVKSSSTSESSLTLGLLLLYKIFCLTRVYLNRTAGTYSYRQSQSELLLRRHTDYEVFY